MSADADEIRALTEQVAALSRKISALTGRVTVMNNRLNAGNGLISASAAFQLGMDIGEQVAAGRMPRQTRRPRRLTAVPPIGGTS
jgi:hypothetical protein